MPFRDALLRNRAALTDRIAELVKRQQSADMVAAERDRTPSPSARKTAASSLGVVAGGCAVTTFGTPRTNMSSAPSEAVRNVIAAIPPAAVERDALRHGACFPTARRWTDADDDDTDDDTATPKRPQSARRSVKAAVGLYSPSFAAVSSAKDVGTGAAWSQSPRNRGVRLLRNGMTVFESAGRNNQIEPQTRVEGDSLSQDTIENDRAHRPHSARVMAVSFPRGNGHLPLAQDNGVPGPGAYSVPLSVDGVTYVRGRAFPRPPSALISKAAAQPHPPAQAVRERETPNRLLADAWATEAARALVSGPVTFSKSSRFSTTAAPPPPAATREAAVEEAHSVGSSRRTPRDGFSFPKADRDVPFHYVNGRMTLSSHATERNNRVEMADFFVPRSCFDIAAAPPRRGSSNSNRSTSPAARQGDATALSTSPGPGAYANADTPFVMAVQRLSKNKYLREETLHRWQRLTAVGAAPSSTPLDTPAR